MAEQRGTATDRLTDVIHVVQLARQTGVLSVVRDSGNVHEEGTLVFVGGQIVDASIGGRSGQEALQILSMWGSCHFTFAHQGASPSTGNLYNTPPGRTTHPNLPAMNGHMPTTGGLPPIGGVPYRIQQAGAVFSLMESMNLSRLHRRLFLLIDGQRSVPELAALTGRRVDEIMNLLDDLQRLGLIQR